MKAKDALMTKISEAPAYTIQNPDRIIHFVSNKSQWESCAKRLKAAKVVGIDTETKPEFSGKKKRNPCSLIQLAIRCMQGNEEVYILDLLKLKPNVYNGTLSTLLLSKQVIKLGQSLFSDLKELVESYPSATCFTVAKSVVEVNDLSITLHGAHHPLSLQKLVYLYLGKRLTKTQQTSNWNRRPLTSSQLHYAASDALVLIHLYDELMKRLQQQQPFQIKNVSNVLDVHIEVARCNLCFMTFRTKVLLKNHRQECCKNVHLLKICSSCNTKKFLTSTAHEEHAAQCNGVGIDVLNEPSGKHKLKRKVSIEIDTNQLSSEIRASKTYESTHMKRKRKLSNASTALASDDIWTQINNDMAF